MHSSSKRQTKSEIVYQTGGGSVCGVWWWSLHVHDFQWAPFAWQWDLWEPANLIDLITTDLYNEAQIPHSSKLLITDLTNLFLLIHFGDIGINLLAPHCCDHTDNFYRDVVCVFSPQSEVWSISRVDRLYALGNPDPGCLPFQECEHRFLDIHLLSSNKSGKRRHILWLPFSHSDVSLGSTGDYLSGCSKAYSSNL